MFAAPPEQSLEWSDSAVEGAHRFLKRLWSLPINICLCIIDVNDIILSGNAQIHWHDTENRLKNRDLLCIKSFHKRCMTTNAINLYCSIRLHENV